MYTSPNVQSKLNIWEPRYHNWTYETKNSVQSDENNLYTVLIQKLKNLGVE